MCVGLPDDCVPGHVPWSFLRTPMSLLTHVVMQGAAERTLIHNVENKDLTLLEVSITEEPYGGCSELEVTARKVITLSSLL